MKKTSTLKKEMLHKTLLIGNWKMNPASAKEAKKLASGFSRVTEKLRNVEIWLCPPFPFIETVQQSAGKKIKVGSQTIFHETEGAHTGEVSVTQLKSIKVLHTIIGHSERRASGETLEQIQKKVSLALSQKIKVILCVGEKTRDQEGEYVHEIKTQIETALLGVSKKDLSNIIIAYEPVWAIGAQAKVPATPHESLEISILIQRTLQDLFSQKDAVKVQIIYGGSASSKNVSDFLKDGGVTGFLLGRASLDLKEMKSICRIVSEK